MKKKYDINYLNSSIVELVSEHVHSERDRKIVLKRMVDGLTFDELSLEFNMSARQIKRIVYKHMDYILLKCLK